MSDSIGDVQAKLTLDGSQFDAQSKKSQETATATGRAREAAAKKAAQAEALAAKFAAEEVTDKSKQQAAAYQMLKIAKQDAAKVEKLARDGYIASGDALNQKAAALQRVTAAEAALAAATKIESEATHAAVSQQMAASAAIRSLEGNPGIRSIERFATTIPGLGSALQAIFPIIGAAGLAGLAVEAGEKLFEMGKKAMQAADLTRQAAAEQHDHAQVSIDDLTVQNDKIQDQIDKLSGHPNNGLRTALDEDKKMADQLLVSLQADRKEFEALMKENSVGTFASVLTGVASTGQQETELTKDRTAQANALRAANTAFDMAVAGSGGDKNKIKAAQDVRNEAIKQVFEGPIETLKRERARLIQEQKDSEEAAQIAMTGPGGGEASVNTINNSSKVANIDLDLSMMQDSYAKEKIQRDIAANDAHLGALKQAKESAKDAKEIERQKAEAQMKAFEQGQAEMEIAEGKSAANDLAYWEAKAHAANLYPENLLKVTEKVKTALDEMDRIGEASIKQAVAEQKKAAEDQAKAYRDLAAAANQWDKALHEEAVDAAKQVEEHAKAAVAMQDEIDKHLEAVGAITKHDLALRMAAAHTAAYRAEIVALRAEQEANNNDASLSPQERKAKNSALDVKISGIDNSQALTSQQDKYAIEAAAAQSSAAHGATEALDELANASQNLSAEMKAFVTGTMSKLNTEFLAQLEGHGKKGDWRKLGGSIFNDAAGSALKQSEGMALKAFGFGAGKSDGSSEATALWVRVKGSLVGTGASNLGSLFGHGSGAAPGTDVAGFGNPFGEGGEDVAGAAASAISGGGGAAGIFGKLGGFLGPLLSHIPGFAEGGNEPANSLELVGEHGPELRKTGFGSSSIIPHEAIAGMGGGDTHITNIDARGTDSAMATARLNRAMAKARSDGARQGMKGSREAYLRSPR